MTAGLCENPDCGAFFDQEGVPFFDRELGREVTLCIACAIPAAAEHDGRYQKIPEHYPPTTIPEGSERDEYNYERRGDRRAG